MCGAELRRVGELRDHSLSLNAPNAYFSAGDTKLSDPAKRRFFIAIEDDLRDLDTAAWTALKAEALPQLTAKAPGRGWEGLFSILNQARAYAHLVGLGCTDVQFIPRSKRKTPDLRAGLGSVSVLCEVKTIHISNVEVGRRQSGGVAASKAHVEPGFLSKLRSDIETASAQMGAFDPDPAVRRIVYVVVNFDDLFHEYEPECRAQIEADLAVAPSSVEVILDIKRPFHAAV
jgi:hypothetical protein